MQNLEEQIAQITNPDDFVRLFNLLLVAEHGTDFQVVDGTRGDDGNDGYLASQQQLFAVYCPRKPERRTDHDYSEKISSDLGKAAELNAAGRFPIRTWTFVTPRKLGIKVIEKLKVAAGSLPFTVGHDDATFLAGLLCKHSHLLREFPFLQTNLIEEKLDEVLRRLPETPPTNVSDREMAAPTIEVPFRGAPETADYHRTIEIRTAEQQDSSKPGLRAIFYGSTDPRAQLNAVLGLLEWWDPADEKPETGLEWCEHGAALAQQLGAKGVEAFVAAQKGFLLSFTWVMEDTATWQRVQVTNLTGVALISEDQRRAAQDRLAAHERGFTESFNTALGLCEASRSVKAWGEVLMTLGNAAGLRAMHLRQFGFLDHAKRDERLCKRALLAAKDLFAEYGHEVASARAVCNLANQMQSLGETKEAGALAERALEVATRYGDFRLKQTADWILESLRTGHVPDYLHGERRERKK